MVLKAGYLATDFAMFNPSYGVGSTFPSVAFQNATHNGPNTGLGGGTYFWMLTFYGWATGSGFVNDRFGKADMKFICLEQGGCSPTVPNGFIDLGIVYRVNGGTAFPVTAQASRAVAGNGTLNAAGGISLTGLASTDTVEFGVRVSAAGGGDQLNVANLTVLALNF